MPIEKVILKLRYEHLATIFTCPYCSHQFNLSSNDEEAPIELDSCYQCVCGNRIEFSSIHHDLVFVDPKKVN